MSQQLPRGRELCRLTVLTVSSTGLVARIGVSCGVMVCCLVGGWLISWLAGRWGLDGMLLFTFTCGVIVALLYESPGGNQVDGLPPAQH